MRLGAFAGSGEAQGNMNDCALYIGIAGLVGVGIAVQFGVTRRRHGRDHRQDLAPILAAHGLTFLSARWPGWFKVGPFPTVEVRWGRPQSHIGGISGEYDEYRVVTCRDPQGTVHELWARLEFELFRLRRIRWRAENGRNLPAQAKALLEN